MCLNLCVPVKQSNILSSLLCWNFHRWHSHGKPSRFRPDRELEATHAYILMYRYTEFCFIQFWSIFSLFPLSPPLWSPPSPPLLSAFLSVMMMVQVCFLHGSPKQFSTNGNLQYCMLKPSGVDGLLLDIGIYERRSAGAVERPCCGVNKWKEKREKKRNLVNVLTVRL